MLKLGVPRLPSSRTHSGTYISGPRADVMSLRSSTRWEGQPNEPSNSTTLC